MEYTNPEKVRASVAMASPEGPGKGYRLVPEFLSNNGRCKLVPRPMLTLS